MILLMEEILHNLGCDVQNPVKYWDKLPINQLVIAGISSINKITICNMQLFMAI